MDKYNNLANAITLLHSEADSQENEVVDLQLTADLPDIPEYCEVKCAAKITQAKIDDSINETNTLGSIKSTIEKERAAHQVAKQERLDSKKTASNQLKQKEALLTYTRGEIKSLGYKIDDLIREQANIKLQPKKDAYFEAVKNLVMLGADIAALKNIIDPSLDMRFFFSNKTIPSLGIDKDVFQYMDTNLIINSSGHYAFPSEGQATLVNDKIKTLKKEIEADLNG